MLHAPIFRFNCFIAVIISNLFEKPKRSQLFENFLTTNRSRFMADLQTGIAIVRSATEKDNAKQFTEAIPLYKSALQYFQRAFDGNLILISFIHFFGCVISNFYFVFDYFSGN